MAAVFTDVQFEKVAMYPGSVTSHCTEHYDSLLNVILFKYIKGDSYTVLVINSEASMVADVFMELEKGGE